MRVLPGILKELAPALKGRSVEEVAGQLTALGFEAEVLPGEQPVIEVSVTPNRADGMSHLGLARDLLAHQTKDIVTPHTTLTLPTTGTWQRLPIAEMLSVNCVPKAVAPQYQAVLMENITVQPSPSWLQERLALLGIRPINNVVDLTNYFMEVYGQPLHAFDADAILGELLTVRESQDGETLETLDGKTHTLPGGIIVIQDREALIDLAGIMGGANSQVQAHTGRILLQAAIFDRTRIRRAANTLNHRTPAATRYERGVDPAIGIPVLERAIETLQLSEFGSAKAVSKIDHTTPRKPITISINPKRVNGLLGMTVAKTRQEKYLKEVGAIVTTDKATYTVSPPSWRFDMELWQDVAEEIARLIGFDTELPAKILPAWKRSPRRSEIEWAEGLKDRLQEIGANEVQTYSFISAQDLRQFELPAVGELANPLNPALRFLRPSLLPNLARVVAENPVFDPVHIYEIGHVFTGEGEHLALGVAIAGNATKTTDWIARLADAIGMDSSKLTKSAKVVDLPQQLKDAYKIRRKRVTLIEIPLSSLQGARKIPTNYDIPSLSIRYRPIPKHPPVSRDIAIVIDRDIRPELVSRHIRSLDERIELVELFDEYISDNLGDHKKSLAFHILYADPDRTLDDEQSNQLHTTVEESIKATFQAAIR